MTNNFLFIKILSIIILSIFICFEVMAEAQYKGQKLLLNKKWSLDVGHSISWLQGCGESKFYSEKIEIIKNLSSVDYKKVRQGVASALGTGNKVSIGCNSTNINGNKSFVKNYIKELTKIVNNKTGSSISSTNNNKLIYCKRSNGTVYSIKSSNCGNNKWITKNEYNRIVNLQKSNSSKKLIYCKRSNGTVYSIKSSNCGNNKWITKNEYNRIVNLQKSNSSKKLIYCKIKNGTTYSTYNKCGYKEEITKDEYDRLNNEVIRYCLRTNGSKYSTYADCGRNKEITKSQYNNPDVVTEAKLYCKRYDGKVFVRKKSCGQMDEISFVEFVSREIANGVPGYYCKRPNGTVYTTSYKNSCYGNKEISHGEYISIKNPNKIIYCKKLNGEIYIESKSSFCKSNERNVSKTEYESAQKDITTNVNSLKFPSFKEYEDSIFSLKKEDLALLEKLSSSQIKNRISGTSSYGSIIISDNIIKRFHEFFLLDGTWIYFELDENIYNFSHTIGEYNNQGEWYIKKDQLCIKPKDGEVSCMSLYQSRNNEINNAIFWVYDNEIFAVTSHIEKTKKFNFNQARTIVLNKLEKEKGNYKKALSISPDFHELSEKYFTKPYIFPFNITHLVKNIYGKDILVSFAGTSLNKVKNESLVKCLNEKSKRSIESECKLLFINFDIYKDTADNESIKFEKGIYYTITNANIRSAPNDKESTKVLITVPKGKIIEVFNQSVLDKEWAEVIYYDVKNKGQDNENVREIFGYMYLPLLSKDQPKIEEKSPQDVEESFQIAFDALRNQDYDNAIIFFEKLIYNHPNSSLAGTAHYWLGEIYLLQKKYREAAITFIKGYQTHSQNIKAPNMLYKLAETLVDLDKKIEACNVLKRLLEEFPESTFISKANKQFENLNCLVVIDIPNNTNVPVNLSNIFRQRLIEVNELFELELINEEDYKIRKLIILNEIDSGSLLMKFLSEKIISRDDFDLRFNELLLIANENIQNDLENIDFSITSMLKDLIGESSEIIENEETNEENLQLSISEIDLLRQQLSSCWIVPAGVVIAKEMIVKISAKIQKNRKVLPNSVRIVDTNISKINSFYGPITESAMRSLLNPDCIPLKLPENKYNLWKNITLTFDYNMMKGY